MYDLQVIPATESVKELSIPGLDFTSSSTNTPTKETSTQSAKSVPHSTAAPHSSQSKSVSNGSSGGEAINSRSSIPTSFVSSTAATTSGGGGSGNSSGGVGVFSHLDIKTLITNGQ